MGAQDAADWARRLKGGAQRKKGAKETRTPPGRAPARTEQPVATTSGYVAIWAGLVLTGKRFLPVARQLFSSRHPACTIQNVAEEAVLAQGLDLLRRVGLRAIVIGDKGLGRKELSIRLTNQEQDAVLRVDLAITVSPPDALAGHLLADALACQPTIGGRSSALSYPIKGHGRASDFGRSLTLPAGLALNKGQHVVEYSLVTASATLALAPLIIAFLCAQRYFVQGTTLAAVKEWPWMVMDSVDW